MVELNSCKDYLQVGIMVVIVYLIFRECLNIDFLDMFRGSRTVQGFENAGQASVDSQEGVQQGDMKQGGHSGGIHAAEPSGNSDFQQVSYEGRSPSACYPQKDVKAEELLPSGGEGSAIQEFNISKPVGEGILQGVNLLDAGYHVGINTVGQSLRNANRQLRSEPPNPQVSVSPWHTSTINPDLPRRPLEVGEACPS
jgi:hypothetical protein